MSLPSTPRASCPWQSRGRDGQPRKQSSVSELGSCAVLHSLGSMTLASLPGGRPPIAASAIGPHAPVDGSAAGRVRRIWVRRSSGGRHRIHALPGTRLALGGADVASPCVAACLLCAVAVVIEARESRTRDRVRSVELQRLAWKHERVSVVAVSAGADIARRRRAGLRGRRAAESVSVEILVERVECHAGLGSTRGADAVAGIADRRASPCYAASLAMRGRRTFGAAGVDGAAVAWIVRRDTRPVAQLFPHGTLAGVVRRSRRLRRLVSGGADPSGLLDGGVTPASSLAGSDRSGAVVAGAAASEPGASTPDRSKSAPMRLAHPAMARRTDVQRSLNIVDLTRRGERCRKERARGIAISSTFCGTRSPP